MCPQCKESKFITKKGFYLRTSDEKKVQRLECQKCGKGFSTQTLSFDYRLRKRRLNQVIFRMLAKGSSQRACAQILGLHPQTIARRLTRFGQTAEKHLRKLRQKSSVKNILIDEMESFEHTKLKPLTIPIAVENKTRRILALDVGKIAAKGHLASISLKKYGKRACERRKVLKNVFEELRICVSSNAKIISDESYHYPKFVKKIFPKSCHQTFKGRKSAITGQGEMKKGGFDPLFFLNHTYAMVRDNIKRLTRRTWCTTKLISQLKNCLFLYAHYHNQILDGVKRPVITNLRGAIYDTSF